MPIKLEGLNPQIREDWNGKGKVHIASLTKGPVANPTKKTKKSTNASQTTPEDMTMDSQAYHDRHRERVVIPSLLQAQARRKAEAQRKDEEA